MAELADVGNESVAASIKRLRRMKKSGLAWILERIDSEGRPHLAEEHNGYYRLPWTLAYLGHRDIAERVLCWIDRHALTLEGDLRSGAPREAFVTAGASYPLSIIAQGAHILERYDISRRVWETLEFFRDQRTGGAFNARPGQGSSLQLAYLTAQLGMTALACGRDDVADAAYGWFARFVNAQPELPRRLFLGWDDAGLVTDLPPTGTYNLVVDFNQPRQAFHTPGIAAAFLARYGAYTGTGAATDLARKLLALHEDATDQQFNHEESSAVCKLGIGAAALHGSSKSDEYLRILQRMARWFEDAQEADGSWVHRSVSRPNPTDAHRLEKTAENLLWVAMMLTALAGTPSNARPTG